MVGRKRTEWIVSLLVVALLATAAVLFLSEPDDGRGGAATPPAAADEASTNSGPALVGDARLPSADAPMDADKRREVAGAEPIPRGRIHGRVRDERDLPAPHVAVTWQHADAHGEPVRTDAHGAFELHDVPLRDGVALALESIVYAPAEHPLALPADAERALELTIVTRGDCLVGWVRDELGAPLEARLAFGPRIAHSNPETGAFQVDLAWLAPHRSILVVSAPGYAPETFADVGAEFLRRGRRHPPLDVTLRPAGLLAGRVVRAGGEPAHGALVTVRDPAPMHDRYAEAHASATGELRQEVDADGGFQLGGLSRRPYTLIALDPETLDYVEREVEPWTDPLRRDLVLELPAPAERRTVRGSLRYPDGEPAGGLSISAFLEIPGRPDVDKAVARIRSVAVDGTFELEDLPFQDLLIAAGSTTYPRRTPLAAYATEVHLVVQRLCPIEIAWPVDVDRPDIARVLDAGGDELEVFRSQWGVFVKGAALTFYSPREPDGYERVEIWVPESATTLVLDRAGAELRRLPIEPAPGRKKRVRP